MKAPTTLIKGGLLAVSLAAFAPVAALAADVLHDDILAQRLLRRAGDDTKDDVGAAARVPGDDELHRPAGQIARTGRPRCGRREQARENGQGR